jgi:hypothetical protein
MFNRPHTVRGTRRGINKIPLALGFTETTETVMYFLWSMSTDQARKSRVLDWGYLLQNSTGLL